MGNNHLVTFICVLLCVSFATASTCLIRVNTLGYLSTANKTAVALCTGTVTAGTTFNVLSGTTTVFSGTIGASITWSTNYPNAYPLVFSSYATTGTFTVRLNLSPAVSSPSFAIDTASHLYSQIFPKSLFFYQAQRDGRAVNTSVLSRQASHLTDDSATIYKIPNFTTDGALKGTLSAVPGASSRNVSGGWFDAGDYLKFTETLSYVVSVMLLAVRDHGNQFQAGGNADFFTEAKVGLDWLLKMWDDTNRVLYYQVGLGDGNAQVTGDHDLWRLPQADDALSVSPGNTKYYIKYRPVFAVANAAPNSPLSPNLAGRMAAAFALGYQVYSVSSPSYAQTCLNYAEHIFAQANTNPTGNLVTASPYDYYPESEWRDDLMLGAVELYYAAKMAQLQGYTTQHPASFFLSSAETWATNYINDADYMDMPNLYDVGGIASYELYIAVNSSSTTPFNRQILTNAMKTLLKAGDTKKTADPFGFSDGYNSGDDLVPHALGTALLADYYQELTGDKTYQDLLTSQIDWFFGRNAWGASFMIGVGSSFPKCPQHQVANLVGSLTGTGSILLGAVVDGPTQSSNLNSGNIGVPGGARACPADGSDVYQPFTGKGARYMDNVKAYASVEPTDDYAVVPLLLFARLISRLG